MNRYVSLRMGSMLFLTLSFITPHLLCAESVENKSTTADYQVIIDPELEEWQVGGGFIYLLNNCNDGTSQTTASVKRRPLQSAGGLTTIQSINSYPQCRTFRHAVVDESGVYYYNRAAGQIEAVITQSPTASPVMIVNIGDWAKMGSGNGMSNLKVYGDYIYWMEEIFHGEFDPRDIEIKRVAKSGGSVTTMISYSGGGVTIDGLGVTNRYIWWTDNEGLNRIDNCGILHQCNPTVPTVKTVEFTQAMQDGHLSIRGSSVLWWNGVHGLTRSSLRYTSCSFFGTCSTSSLYLAAETVVITGVVATSTHAYWVESAGGGVGSRLRRILLSGGSPETLVENMTSAAPGIDSWGVYYQNLESVYRILFDAEALTHEMSMAGWEVTQGIQRLSNDVPLISGKSTFVRVYPQLDNGEDAGGVISYLYGYKNGQELPESPLYPVNGSIAVRAGQGLENRPILDKGWLFRIPENWTRTGSELLPQTTSILELKAVMDPHGTYADTDDPVDNEIEGQFVFTAKAPTCLKIRPVKTHAPYQAPSGINIAQVMELTESILPTSKIIVFPEYDHLEEVKWCWVSLVYGPFCSTPYELEDDAPWLLAKLTWLDSWASSPLICKHSNARTLYSGVVHSEAEWGALGVARRGKDELISKVPVYGSTIDRFSNLPLVYAHEIGHNYSRKHIDCGGPDDTDTNYPYPPCALDNSYSLEHSDLHYGFDPLLLEPIVASTTADLMAYTSARWISDYTWKSIFNVTQDPVFVPPPKQLYGNTDTIIISGVVESSGNAAELDFVWHVPEDQLNTTLQEKIVAGVSLEKGTGNLHMQLLGVTGLVLADKVIDLSLISEIGTADFRPFQIVMNAPVADVSKIQIMDGNTILSARSIGANVPTISLNLPTGGENISHQLELEWSASDSDEDDLMYTIHYSADLGSHWNPVRVNFGGSGQEVEHVTLDFSGMQGSYGMNALIRVMVSDGYHTQTVTSQPFSVEPKEPLVVITSPAASEVFSAEQTMLLRGMASDIEDGFLANNQFSWSSGLSGKEGELRGLQPGIHDLSLTATDSDGLTGIDAIQIKVLPLSVPSSLGLFSLDGFCDDDGYEDSRQVQLSSYADGSRAMTRIVYNFSYMWICMTELKGSGQAGLFIDRDHSRDAVVQSGDFGYFVQRDGTPVAREGNGSSFQDILASSIASRVIDHGSVWSAELRIKKSAFGDFQRQLGMSLGHLGFSDNSMVSWPGSAQELNPASWGSTNLGLDVHMNSIQPNKSVVGAGDFTLTVDGSGFTTDSRVEWGGVVLDTTFVSATILQAIVPASQQAAAGAIDISISSASVSSLETGSLEFLVQNPRSIISQLTPNKALFGSSATEISIVGSNFVNGATILISGQQRQATFVSENELRVIANPAELIAAPVTLSIRVINPEPVVGLSEIKEFNVLTLDQFPIFEDSFE